MKKYMLAVFVVILGVSFGLPQMTVSAEEEEKLEESGEKKINIEEPQEAEPSPEVTDINHLLIPQKLQVVLDPWEMDGKGQIYSEQYTIKNTGETPGTLILSNLACQTGEDSGVTVKEDARGLHEDDDKSVYMEMIFGDKDKIILSQEGAVYKAEMKPGEELTLSFSGEINENAAKNWRNGELGVTVTYSWEPKEVSAGSKQEPEKETAEPEKPKADLESEEKEEPEITELKEANQFKLAVDSWETDENGTICSAQYRMRNVGETTGIFALSELICKPAEQSGITVQTDKEKLHEGEDKSVYMELVAEQKEGEEAKLVFRQDIFPENPEASEYKVELKPGEELIFRFVGELNGINTEDLKEGDIAVATNCSWTLEETVSE